MGGLVRVRGNRNRLLSHRSGVGPWSVLGGLDTEEGFRRGRSEDHGSPPSSGDTSRRGASVRKDLPVHGSGYPSKDVSDRTGRDPRSPDPTHSVLSDPDTRPSRSGVESFHASPDWCLGSRGSTGRRSGSPSAASSPGPGGPTVSGVDPERSPRRSGSRRPGSRSGPLRRTPVPPRTDGRTGVELETATVSTFTTCEEEEHEGGGRVPLVSVLGPTPPRLVSRSRSSRRSQTPRRKDSWAPLVSIDGCGRGVGGTEDSTWCRSLPGGCSQVRDGWGRNVGSSGVPRPVLSRGRERRGRGSTGRVTDEGPLGSP